MRISSALLILCTLLAGCGGGSSDTAGAPSGSVSPPAPRLEAAFKACRGSDIGQTTSLADVGKTIEIDTGSRNGSLDGMLCLFEELETPRSVEAAVEATTSLQGVRTAEDKGLSYSWTYHPKNGVDMVIEDTSMP